MSPIGWIDSHKFDLHINGFRHPECPERLHVIRSEFEQSGIASKLERLEATPVDQELLKRVHRPDYVDALERLCEAGGAQLDPDTSVIRESWPAALNAAGAVTTAVDRVLSGHWHRAFCTVRPPGHHAPANRAMGFCLFNNIAIGAQAALEHEDIDRVAIIDWDAHHGNGTQSIFWKRSDVLYASWHQFPFYPGTGAAREEGESDGLGTTVNCPLPTGAGDAEFMQMWSERIVPALERFTPDLLLVSAGFDADARDPLTGLRVTADGFQKLSSAVVTWADAHCGGQIVSVLEGGYDLQALAEDARRHVETLL